MSIRKFAGIAIAAGLLIGTTGCSFTSPIASLKVYSPSDGEQLTIGDIHVRNMILLSNGTTESLIGSIVNSGLTDALVTIQYSDINDVKQTTALNIAAGKKLDLGYNGNPGISINSDALPGQILAIYFGAGSEPATELAVPVLDGTLKQYAELVAGLTAPTPAVTGVPAP